MFEMMMAEKLITEIKTTSHGTDPERAFRNLVNRKLSLADRFLSTLGQVMVKIGSNLMERSCPVKANEEAHAPNFLIML
jgi:hypothetical protein